MIAKNINTLQAVANCKNKKAELFFISKRYLNCFIFCLVNYSFNVLFIFKV